MNKKMPFLRYFIPMSVIPLGGAALLCVIFCILQKNYYYLPYSLDFLIQLSYDAMYVFLFAALFFSIGISAAAALFYPIGNFVCVAVTGLLSSMIIPLLMYFIRLLFLGSESATSVMENYFTSDALCAIENGARFFIALLIVIAVKIYYSKKKTEPSLEKPYFLPNGAVQLSMMIFYASWLIIALVSFVASETHEVGSILYEAALAFVGYFLSVFAALLFFEKKSKQKKLK